MCCYAQKPAKGIQKIDSLIGVADQFHLDLETEKLLQTTIEIVSESKKINNEKGLVYGNFYFAICFYNINQYRESIRYLHKAQQYKSYLDSNPSQNICIIRAIGDNYSKLELYSLAAKEYHKSLNILKKVKAKNEIDLLTESSCYGVLSELYYSMNLKDSVYYYLNKEQNILKDITIEDAHIEKSSSYIGLGKYHKNNGNSDSAFYYYQKSLSQFEEKSHPYKADALSAMANIYSAQKKYPEAFSLYFTALENYKKEERQSTKSIYTKR